MFHTLDNHICYIIPSVGTLISKAKHPKITITKEKIDVHSEMELLRHHRKPDRSFNIPLSEECIKLKIKGLSEMIIPLPIDLYIHDDTVKIVSNESEVELLNGKVKSIVFV